MPHILYNKKLSLPMQQKHIKLAYLAVDHRTATLKPQIIIMSHEQTYGHTSYIPQIKTSPIFNPTDRIVTLSGRREYLQ